jgi:predicted RNA-binding protein with PIN domain
MPYLIDGHNVIGQTPGLSLDDPDDEVKLVLLVRRHCLREKRKATVIFDGGLPGGVSSLSTRAVAVIFASDRHTTADDLIIKRIEAERNPSGLIVVSSDQKIVAAARQRQMATRTSAEFGRLLVHKPAPTGAPEKERGLTQSELAEWENLFKRGKSRPDPKGLQDP